jgi:PD-(D/E)XK nuclease superfamily
LLFSWRVWPGVAALCVHKTDEIRRLSWLLPNWRRAGNSGFPTQRRTLGISFSGDLAAQPALGDGQPVSAPTVGWGLQSRTPAAIPSSEARAWTGALCATAFMRHSDPNCRNLFQRLFTFAPRTGHDPLENYLTETLVWCLQNSDSFARNVLRELRSLPLPQSLPTLEISTQTGFRNETEEGNRGGVFDIVIKAQDDSFLVVMEAKTWWPISEKQIRKYHQELSRGEEYRTVEKKRRYLVGLTNWAYQDRRDLNDQIKWSQIVELLSVSRIKKEPFGSVLQQFREYLILKGLGPMNLHHVDGKFAAACKAAYHFRDDLVKILDSVKTEPELKAHFSHKKLAYESSDEVLDMGIYGRRPSVLGWYGFRFFPSKILMHVSLVRKGRFDIPKTARQVFPHEARFPTETWVYCEQTLDSGNSDEDFMRRWFVDNCKKFIHSQKLLAQRA